MPSHSPEAKRIAALSSHTLDLPPSCAEFSPAHPELVVVGSYLLNEATATRSGSLSVWRIDDDGSAALRQQLPQPWAVLDVRFAPRRPALLAAAGSGGCVGLVGFDGELGALRVVRVPGIETDALVLALAWHPCAADTLAVAVASGAVLLVRLDDDGICGAVEVTALRNDLEAWSVAYGGDSGDVLLAGGDDSVLRFAEGGAHGAIRDAHGAGVTAILPLQAGLVATGSYDGRLRVLALPGGRVLVEADLGGGVWRLQEVEAEEGTRVCVLASCMHAGACVVDIVQDDADWRVVVRARFTEHQSMNYASAAQPRCTGSGLLRCVSTSFYDRLLCVWEVDLDQPLVNDGWSSKHFIREKAGIIWQPSQNK